MSNRKLADQIDALLGFKNEVPRIPNLARELLQAAASALRAEPDEAARERIKTAVEEGLHYGLPQVDASLVPADLAESIARAALSAISADPDDGWLLIDQDTPMDQRVLVWWPQHRLDEDDNPTGEIVGGEQLVSAQRTGSWGPHAAWEEPDWISGHGLHMDDDWCWAPVPTHWRPLPAPPAAMRGGENG